MDVCVGWRIDDLCRVYPCLSPSDLGLSPAPFLTLASNTDLNIDAEDEGLVFSSVLILVYFIYLCGCVIWRRSNSMHSVFVHPGFTNWWAQIQSMTILKIRKGSLPFHTFVLPAFKDNANPVLNLYHTSWQYFIIYLLREWIWCM